jgi:hypothetical protein
MRTTDLSVLGRGYGDLAPLDAGFGVRRKSHPRSTVTHEVDA